MTVALIKECHGVSCVEESLLNLFIESINDKRHFTLGACMIKSSPFGISVSINTRHPDHQISVLDYRHYMAPFSLLFRIN